MSRVEDFTFALVKKQKSQRHARTACLDGVISVLKKKGKEDENETFDSVTLVIGSFWMGISRWSYRFRKIGDLRNINNYFLSMKKHNAITITFKDGSIKRWSDKQIQGFEINGGIVYIQSADEIEIDSDGAGGEISWHGEWYNLTEIASMESDKSAILEDQLEVLKYKKFKELGMDTTKQSIAETTVEMAKSMVMQDKLIKQLEEAVRAGRIKKRSPKNERSK